MVLNITKLGEDVLRQKATPVTEINDDIRKLAEDMFDTMIAANGVGLACPQVGLSIRMFVIIADDDVRRVFINPQIIKTTEETCDYEEGCLSLPQVWEVNNRPEKNGFKIRLNLFFRKQEYESIFFKSKVPDIITKTGTEKRMLPSIILAICHVEFGSEFT